MKFSLLFLYFLVPFGLILLAVYWQRRGRRQENYRDAVQRRLKEDY